jgi:NAD(P)-dependent dehydrogenase (short-subunit alcohol dehydrogenase family)
VAYGQAKTANIYLATEIERRYGHRGLHATAVHPGGILATDLARHMDPSEFSSFNTPEWQRVMKSPEQVRTPSVGLHLNILKGKQSLFWAGIAGI